MSLSKLALLASSEDEEGEKEEKVRRLNDQLHHIAVQQSLPEEILEVYVQDVKIHDIVLSLTYKKGHNYQEFYILVNIY